MELADRIVIWKMENSGRGFQCREFSWTSETEREHRVQAAQPMVDSLFFSALRPVIRPVSLPTLALQNDVKQFLNHTKTIYDY